MFFKNELKKILRFPLFWTVIAACVGLNMFIITSNMSYERAGIKVVNSYVKTEDVPAYDKYGFCEDYDQVKKTAYDTHYKNFDIWKLKEMCESMFTDKNSDAAQRIIDKNYKIVEARLDEIKTDGEALEEYYPGSTYSLHRALYENVFSIMLFELAVTAIFMTSYLMKYDEFHFTHYSVYTSKTGRAIVFSKALAALTASIMAATIIVFATVVYFLILIPQSADFLKSSVSAAMATETRGLLRYPFITWNKMSQMGYLMRASLLSICYAALASMITFVISFVSKNAYINAIMTAMLYFGFVIIGYVIPGNNIFGFALIFTPTSSMLNVSNWFMEYTLSPFTSYPNYETYVCFAYMVISILVSMALWRYFKVKNMD